MHKWISVLKECHFTDIQNLNLCLSTLLIISRLKENSQSSNHADADNSPGGDMPSFWRAVAEFAVVIFDCSIWEPVGVYSSLRKKSNKTLSLSLSQIICVVFLIDFQ